MIREEVIRRIKNGDCDWARSLRDRCVTFGIPFF